MRRLHKHEDSVEADDESIYSRSMQHHLHTLIRNSRLRAVATMLSVVAILFAMSSAQALDLVVNSVADDHDAQPGDGTCETTRGSCTLRAAIEEANAALSGEIHAITFDLLPGVTAPIVVTEQLPPIIARVSLDGAIGISESGSIRRIQINGSRGGDELLGLWTMTAGTTIANVEVFGFPRFQILLKGSTLLGSRIGRFMPDGRPYPSSDPLVIATEGSQVGSESASILPCEGDCNVIGPALNGAISVGGSDSLVAGNHIGFDEAAVSEQPIGQTAVRVEGAGSFRTMIGGVSDENLILAGDGSAVLVAWSESTRVQHHVPIGPNIIRTQAGAAESVPYRLSSAGFVENDADDADTGPNSLLNHPDAIELSPGSGCAFELSGIAAPASQLLVYAASPDDTTYPGTSQLLGVFTVDGPNDGSDGAAAWENPDVEGAASRFSFSVPAICFWPGQKLVLQTHLDGESSQLTRGVSLDGVLPDTDGDGVVDVVECACGEDVGASDADSDGVIDRFDVDADGDGTCELPLVTEPFGSCDCGPDLDCSGIVDPDEMAEVQPQCDEGDEFDPTVTEVCDGVDNNCDGMVDEGPDIIEQTDPGRVGGILAYGDADGDGCGFGSVQQVFCEGAGGYAMNADDANDEDGICCGNGELEPNEPCDGYKSNAPGCPAGFTGSPMCENQPGNADGDGTCTYGEPPDGCEAAVVCYADRDGDGFAGTALAFVEGTVCADESDGDDTSLSDTLEDCADFPQQECSALSFPGGEEVCDGCDNDCDSTTPDGADEPDGIYFVDADADGCGAHVPLCGKAGQPGFVQNNDDADDGDGQCCGNGIVEGTEECDSSDDVLCADIGEGSTGLATCSVECRFNTFECDPPPDSCPQDHSEVEGICVPDQCREGYAHGPSGCIAENCRRAETDGQGRCNPDQCLPGYTWDNGRCYADDGSNPDTDRGSNSASTSDSGCNTATSSAPLLSVLIWLLGVIALVVTCRRVTLDTRR